MSNNGQSAKRASFSGKIGYVLAVAGSAVVFELFRVFKFEK